MNDAIDSIRTSRPNMSSRTVFALWYNSSPGRREPALARSAGSSPHPARRGSQSHSPPADSGAWAPAPADPTCKKWGAPVSRGAAIFTRPFAYDTGRSRDGEARPASSTAKMPVRNMPSNVPAPPMEAIGAPRLPILSRLRISAPISVPMDPPI